MKDKSLYLIDGSAIFYRAYFAFIRNPLINSKGENTSATYGFLYSIMKILKDEKPDYIAVVFDTKAPTFRHKMYSEYKSTRAKMPDDLVEQLPRIREAVEALNLVALEKEGFEADDIIGTYARLGEEKGMNVWIVSGDKDMFQLVSDHVKIHNPGNATKPTVKLDAKGVEEKFGVLPEKVIDMLALMGDASDHVPGIPGIGPKTALNLLKEFGSFDNILESAEKIKAKGTRKKVEENKDKALLSRQLVTIDTNVSLSDSLESLKSEKPDFEKAKKLFLELEFKGLLDELAQQSGHLDLKLGEGDPVQQKAAKDVEYICVDTIPKLKEMLGEFENVKEIAVDTETTSLNTLEADLVGISFCAKPGRAFYLPIGHDDTKRNLPQQEASQLISELLTDKKIQKIGQNIKYDLEVFHRAGYDIDPISFDTMLASYVISPSGRRHGLDSLAFEYFNYRMQPISDLIGKGAKQTTFNTVDVDTAVFYAAEDADYTYRLRGVLAPQIDELNLQNLYYNIELPLVKVLASLEEEGVKVDANYLGKMSLDMEGQLHKLTNDIYSEASQEFNINSTQQLAKILFEKLKLPTKSKTTKKTGYSTDVKVLEELAEIHALPKLILEYRQLTKLKSTYIDAIPKLINKETGRVHTSFNQTIAATGRLSSTEPNLQNIPIRTEIGRQIRKAFVPRDKNYELLVADYSQIELRILAHITNDKTLIAAFKNNEDIHSRTAAEVYGADINNVSPEMRRAAKTANFAIIYGVSAYGLSQQTELNLGESKDFIDTYLERYPGIKTYMDESIKFAREKGYVKTLLNRIRYLPEINSKNYQMRQFAERIAINTPIQGTAADMIKIAMINIHNNMANLKSKMTLQVHDELVFDMYKKESEELQKIVRVGMEKALKLKVPIVADMGIGPSWLEAK